MSRRPLPAAIYWRRRLLLLAVVLLVVWGAIQLWPNGGGDDPTPRATAPRTTATPAAGSDGETTVSLASSGTACDAEDVRIVPSVRPDQRAGEPVDVDLIVSTTSTKACTLTLRPNDVLAVISAGSTAVWDSSVCKTSLVTDPIGLSPGWSTVASVRWSGRGSGGGCSPREGYASPGRYTMRVGTLGGEPGATTFRLEQPKPKPKPSRTTPSPKKSEDKKSDDDEKKPSPTPSASPSER